MLILGESEAKISQKGEWIISASGWGGALTGSEPLLQKADLLAQRVDAVQLLEGVGQEARLLSNVLAQRA